MSVNDRIWTSLSQHGGGTINERVYNYLGSLGFTGTISDRLAKYTHNNKHGWQALIEGFGLSGSAGVLRQELFGAAQEGVMYVPQPTYLGQQVLSQDSAGTTPVTGDGQPVGLMLDLSQGLVLGPEELADTEFDDPGYWAAQTDVEVVGGQAVWTSSGNGFGVTPGKAAEEGATYEATYEVSGVTQGAVGLLESGVQRSSPGIYKEIFTVDTFEAASGFKIRAFGTTSATVDSISIRKLPGNHATAPSDAARPLHSDTPPLQVYDDVDDEMDVTLPSIAAATVATATPSGVVIDYPVDLSGGSYTINEPHSGILIREGELTAEEQQQVTNFLNDLAGT